MQKTNNERLLEIAEGMQDLNNRLVYVGGVMAGSYATDPAAAEPRTTIDVDCVVNTSSYSEHTAFEDELRKKHFQNDITPNAPICRWVYRGEIVDVMSFDAKSLSFGNKWYRPGFAHRELYILSNGTQIYRLPVIYYVATKLEALFSRGGLDWRGAKDFEDIVYVLNYCPEFVDDFKKADRNVQHFVSDSFTLLMHRPNIREEVECCINPEELDRVDLVFGVIQKVSQWVPETLKIQYVSDLHLEFPQNRAYLEAHPLEPTGDILIVAGDSAYLDVPESGEDTYSKYAFWDWASEHYRQVIVCLGNHDFYGYYDLATMHNGFCKQIRHNVHAYYNNVVHLQDVDIIVSTLWAMIPPHEAYQTERGVSDFYRIRYGGHKLTADDFNREHEHCLAFIKQAVAASTARTKIVVTHHVPTQLCTAPEFLDSPINGAFTVELGNYIADANIDYWIYGHSHRNIKAEIEGTTIVSNQLGYVSHGEHLRNGFNPEAHISI